MPVLSIRNLWNKIILTDRSGLDTTLSSLKQSWEADQPLRRKVYIDTIISNWYLLHEAKVWHPLANRRCIPEHVHVYIPAPSSKRISMLLVYCKICIVRSIYFAMFANNPGFNHQLFLPVEDWNEKKKLYTFWIFWSHKCLSCLALSSSSCTYQCWRDFLIRCNSLFPTRYSLLAPPASAWAISKVILIFPCHILTLGNIVGTIWTWLILRWRNSDFTRSFIKEWLSLLDLRTKNVW